MGREVRRVPPDWDHPICPAYGRYTPLYGRNYEEAAKEWANNCALWERGEHPDQLNGDGEQCKHFWEWDGDPPNKYDFVEYLPEEATWYQLYENASEGTPVTPPFETKEELIEHLVKVGEFIDEKPYGRKRAQTLVESGRGPSFVFRG
jgi:hypothetical protein